MPLACAGLVLAACGASATPARSNARAHGAASEGGAGPQCGSGAQATVGAATLEVAQRIYRLELESSEVRADRRQVAGYGPLLSALAAGNRAGVQAAVSALVYSHTHIVRLRITRGGSLVADVGGPYIIAPVSGILRLHGRVIGRYEFSVQDDLGYVKLEQRYVGAPLILRSGGRRIPLEGTLGDAHLAYSGPVHTGGASYFAESFDAGAYPSGTLRVTLLAPAAGSSRRTCAAVRADQLAAIGERIWGRFISVGAGPASFATALSGLTGSLAYVLAGSHLVAGSTRRAPAGIRDAATLRVRGVTYSVRSFAASAAGASVRVYQLIP